MATGPRGVSLLTWRVVLALPREQRHQWERWLHRGLMDHLQDDLRALLYPPEKAVLVGEGMLLPDQRSGTLVNKGCSSASRTCWRLWSLFFPSIPGYVEHPAGTQSPWLKPFEDLTWRFPRRGAQEKPTGIDIPCLPEYQESNGIQGSMNLSVQS